MLRSCQVYLHSSAECSLQIIHHPYPRTARQISEEWKEHWFWDTCEFTCRFPTSTYPKSIVLVRLLLVFWNLQIVRHSFPFLTKHILCKLRIIGLSCSGMPCWCLLFFQYIFLCPARPNLCSCQAAYLHLMFLSSLILAIDHFTRDYVCSVIGPI
jgi:hypothetical protein